MSIIEIKEVPFPYKCCNKSLTLSIQRNKYTTIIGRNGSGKTTLLKLITGLIKHKSGEIIVNDIIMDHSNVESIYSIRKSMGVLFQNPEYQLIGSTVEQSIEFGLINMDRDKFEIEKLIKEYSVFFGLDDLLKKSIIHLSGGEKQKIALISAIITNPSIIILDEFTSMLDRNTKSIIFDMIEIIRKEEDMIIVSITHDIDEVLNSDRVILIESGEIKFHGKPSDIVSKLEELCL